MSETSFLLLWRLAKRRSMDSGALISDFSTAGPFKFSASVAQSVNCSRYDPNAELACLRGLPLRTLLPAILAQSAAIAPPYGTGVIHPLVDGDFIPDRPSRLLQEGSFVKGRVIRCAPPPKYELTSLQAYQSSIPGWRMMVANLFPPPSSPKPQLLPFSAACSATLPVTNSSRSIRWRSSKPKSPEMIRKRPNITALRASCAIICFPVRHSTSRTKSHSRVPIKLMSLP